MKLHFLQIGLFGKVTLIDMIILAIKHGDTEMMTNLRAREIPRLYRDVIVSKNNNTDFDKECNKDFIEAISNKLIQKLNKLYDDIKNIDQIILKH